MQLTDKDALLVIDVQNDFCAAGALEVPHADEVIEPINKLCQLFQLRVYTQDWHPADHQSFASQPPGASPFSTTAMPYGEQTLWPDHCVQGSSGAEFHSGLDVRPASMIVRKGHRPAVDSYSAFFENDRQTSTGLRGYLNELGIQRVFCCGLALDYCVRFSAEDARKSGFDTWVIVDACRAIDMDGSLDAAQQSMLAAGIKLINGDQLIA